MKTSLILIGMGLITSVNAHAFNLKTSETNKDVLNLLSYVQNRLPSKFKQTIGNDVIVEFAKIGNKEIDITDCGPSNNSDKKIAGYHQSGTNKIIINNAFVTAIKNKKTSLKNCSYDNLNDFFKSTIIHELAHIYDTKRNISRLGSFLNISGWYQKGLLGNRRVNNNTAYHRSPNPYEFKSPSEAFAVNLEYFLMDPNFKCRRPTFNEFYKNEFNYEPYGSYNCVQTNKFLVNSQYAISSSKTLEELDFNRLYEVHYVLAGDGEQASSRFGHSMLRLVMCAPGKKPNPSCLNDVTHHVMLSFAANVTETRIDTMKGLSGKYPSNLHVKPFIATVLEYTKGELREVSSYPLKMTKDELLRFSQRTLEILWSYSGKYYFLSNNCADETLNLLKVAYVNNKNIQSKSVNTPKALLRYLISNKLVNDSIFKNLEQARISGHYYESQAKKVEKSFNFLKIKNITFDNFINLSNIERKNIYSNSINSSSDRKLAIANTFRVEDMILDSKTLKLNSEIIFQINQDQINHSESSPFKYQFEKISSLNNQINKYSSINKGYGIPLASEYRTVPDHIKYSISNEIREIKENILNQAAALYTKEQKDIEESDKILIWLKELY